MDFIYLRTFCEVARCGSFTQAAETLGYGQSSVTMQMQKLEEQYGAVLFERSRRRMQLTQAGEVLLPYARQILELQAEAKARISAQDMGTITIGTIETVATFYVPPLLQTFRRAHPGITLALQAGNEGPIVQAVKAGQVDLGLILDVASSDPELESLLLRKEEFALVTLPESPYGHLPTMSVQELTNAHLILTEEGCTYRNVLVHELRQAGIPHQVVCAFGSVEAIKQCVMHGLGIAFLPRVTVEEEVARGTLQAIPFSHPSNLYTQAIYLKRKWKSHAFQHLLELMGGGV